LEESEIRELMEELAEKLNAEKYLRRKSMFLVAVKELAIRVELPAIDVIGVLEWLKSNLEFLYMSSRLCNTVWGEFA